MSLSARGLDYGFAHRAIGRGLDLELPAGCVACLIGPNGSGKTTLMRTLLGLLPPLGGELTLDGRRLESWDARSRAARLAYVPQAAESYFDFTLLEIVEMARSVHRGAFAGPGREDRRAGLEALGRVGLAALAHRPIHSVSGGERQLALVARALATRATHLVMDEPTANLDFGNQALVLEEIARLGAEGHAILFSTHDPDHALRVADRVVMLRDGAVMASGEALGTVNSGNLSALYGRPVEVVDVGLPGGRRARACVAGGGRVA